MRKVQAERNCPLCGDIIYSYKDNPLRHRASVHRWRAHPKLSEGKRVKWRAWYDKLPRSVSRKRFQDLEGRGNA